MQFLTVVFIVFAAVLQDSSRFVSDVTLPDGSEVKAGSTVLKQWRIQNTGKVEWKDRYIIRVEPQDRPDTISSDPKTRIPDTAPGKECLISVKITVPNKSGGYYASWKMGDENGTQFFPEKGPIYVYVVVK